MVHAGAHLDRPRVAGGARLRAHVVASAGIAPTAVTFHHGGAADGRASCACELVPQLYTSPSAAPAATCTTLAPPPSTAAPPITTGAGGCVRIAAAVPGGAAASRPSWPCELEPQDQTRPLAESASECTCPPTSCTKLSTVGSKPGSCSAVMRGGAPLSAASPPPWAALADQPRSYSSAEGAPSAHSATSAAPCAAAASSSDSLLSPHRKTVPAPAADASRVWKPPQPKSASSPRDKRGETRRGTSSRSMPAGRVRQSWRAASSPHDQMAGPSPSSCAAGAVAASTWKPHTAAASTRAPAGPTCTSSPPSGSSAPSDASDAPVGAPSAKAGTPPAAGAPPGARFNSSCTERSAPARAPPARVSADGCSPHT
eukprot:scaffold256361_cov31-Tisochrysis_lutea.AAC.2